MDTNSLQAVIDRWSVGETDWSHRDITTLLSEINRLGDDIQELTCGDPRRVCPNCRESAVSANGDPT